MEYKKEDLTEAKRQIDSTLHKLRETIKTLETKENASRYKSQITLAKRRVKAFEMANGFIEKECKEIKGFAHVALYTSRFEDTIQFYQDVFNAENLGYFETNVKGCWLKIGEDILEIFESSRYGDGSFKHIAIACDNVDELFNKALTKGAEPHVSPKDITLHLNQKTNARIAFIKGINDEQIELFQKYY